MERELSAEDKREIGLLVTHRGYQLLLSYIDLYLRNLQSSLMDESKPLEALRKLRQWQVTSKILETLTNAPETIYDELNLLTNNYDYPELESYLSNELRRQTGE